MPCGCNGNGNGGTANGTPTIPPSSMWLPSQGMTAPNNPQPLGGTPIQSFRTSSAPLTIGSTAISDRGLTWLAIILAFVGLFMNGRRS